MAFESLTEKLSAVFRKLGARGRLSENDVRNAMREVRLALLEADVNYTVVKDFTEKITDRAVGADIMKSLTPAQTVIKIVNEELISLLGGSSAPADAKNSAAKVFSKQGGGNFLKLTGGELSVIVLCGLQGSGKTTQSVKLALYLKNKGRSPLLGACDVYRPAAIEQLKILGKNAKIDVFSEEIDNVVQIARDSVKFAKGHGNDVLILDTSGRLHIDQVLMEELEDIRMEVKPTEILLVVDAMTGQDAVNVAKAFNERLDITGVIMTKLDGDARGGAALSVLHTCGKPIKFMGTGEKIGNFEPFNAERIASRILGMGDIMSLIENAQANIDKENADKITKKFMENKFDFEDFLSALSQIKKMGSIKSILEKIPFIPMAKNLNSVNADDKIFDKVEAMIFSMTVKERRNPEIINPSRKQRIAAGSGKKIEEVNMLVKKFEEMKKFMKHLTGGKKGLFGMKKPGIFSMFK
jgi:signal recognition particle subunit SRP54